MAFTRSYKKSGDSALMIHVKTDISSLYGETVTILNGSTVVGTVELDNQGEADYQVDDVGTYTVTCQGYSTEVEVTDAFPALLGVQTISVPLYSAALDTVTFTDLTGQKTVNTDEFGCAFAEITFSEELPNIVFTSSVAKNPDNLSNAYSKTVALSTSITNVKVMPEKTIYWYGYKGITYSQYPILPGQSRNSSKGCIEYTNYVYLSATAYATVGGVNIDTSTIHTVYVITKTTGTRNSNLAIVNVNNSNNWDYTNLVNKAAGKYSVVERNTSGIADISVYTEGGLGVYALWYD